MIVTFDIVLLCYEDCVAVLQNLTLFVETVADLFLSVLTPTVVSVWAITYSVYKKSININLLTLIKTFDFVRNFDVISCNIY